MNFIISQQLARSLMAFLDDLRMPLKSLEDVKDRFSKSPSLEEYVQPMIKELDNVLKEQDG